jgi:predicted house-cleaning NTP pyrophosphatase (Maf/HAM1 superfamily)
MTVLFVTDNERKTAALDFLHLRLVNVKSDIDESLFTLCTPQASDLAVEMAELKVEEFVTWYKDVYKLTNNFSRLWNSSGKDYCDLEVFPPRLVMSTHTLIEDEHHLVGKAKNSGEIRELLYRLRDKGATVIQTAICLHDLVSDKKVSCTSTSTITFRFDIEDSFIEDYINTTEAFEGDGSFLLNGRALFLINSIFGEPLSMMGLPLHKFHLMLRELGIPLRELWIK